MKVNFLKKMTYHILYYPPRSINNNDDEEEEKAAKFDRFWQRQKIKADEQGSEQSQNRHQRPCSLMK